MHTSLPCNRRYWIGVDVVVEAVVGERIEVRIVEGIPEVGSQVEGSLVEGIPAEGTPVEGSQDVDTLLLLADYLLIIK